MSTSAELFEVQHDFYIESSRHLPQLPENHPCRSLHGHSFQVRLILKGPLNGYGWVIDFHEIAVKAKVFIDQLDHKLLNGVEGLENPTSEHICRWLFVRLKTVLPLLTRVEISETRDTRCAYPSSIY